MYNERNNTTSEPLASELLRHYLSREAVPGIERELEYARRFLATITTAEVSAYAKDAIHDDNRVVLSSEVIEALDAPGAPGATPGFFRRLSSLVEVTEWAIRSRQGADGQGAGARHREDRGARSPRSA
jgi:hypothetical protein